MRIKEFLRGPLPDDALQELEAKFGGPLTRLYVVGFKGRYVNPDGKAEEVLKRYGLLAQDGGVKACVAGYGVVDGKWYGPPATAVGRYVDIASSDAIFAGAPRNCKSDEAKPAVIDIIRIDKDFKAPRFIVRRADGKVQVIDRGSGVVVKEFPEEKYSAKVAAKALKVPVDEIKRAELWGEDGSVPAGVLKWQMRLAAERAAKKKLDVRFMLSGAKGFHILLTLERPAPASWRPAIVKKLAEWLNVEADPATLDLARKLRVPWTVHTETGRLAVFVNPYTLEPVDFDWPKPVPYALVKTLAALGMLEAKSAPRPESRARRHRAGWVPYLEAVTKANPGLKEDCRKRFSALFGCACAVDGLDAEACAERLAAALGFGELPRAYAAAMELAFKVCARRIAEGQKPLFSIRRALTLDVGEGEGKVWYSIKECVTVLPRFGDRQAEETAEGVQIAEEEPAEEQASEAEAPAPEAEVHAPPEAVASSEEEAWRELEQFIREHLPAAGAQRSGVIEKKSKDEILREFEEIVREYGEL